MYLQRHEIDIGIEEDDPISFYHAMEGSYSQNWIEDMMKFKSKRDIKLCDLIPLLEGLKCTCYKWIF